MTDEIYKILKDKSEMTETVKQKDALINRFTEIINEFGLENDSKTPDYILAEYLYDCLVSVHLIICRRAVHYNPKGYTE